VGDFFAPRCRSKSKQLSEDGSASQEKKSIDDEPQDTVPQVEVVKVENVRRSSRLSAQAAATAIAQALQVTVKFNFKMHVTVKNIFLQHYSAFCYKIFPDKIAFSQNLHFYTNFQFFTFFN